MNKKSRYTCFLIWLGCRDFRPIISMYMGFGTRYVIYECSLTGERKEVRMWRNFGDAFPIETTLGIDFKTYNAILAGEDYERIGHGAYLKTLT